MKEATVECVIEAPIEKIYEIICNMTAYSEFMRDVTEVEMLKKYDNGDTKTKWEVDFEGTPFFWIEIDEFDKENFRIDYKISQDPEDESDVENLTGYWQLEKINGNRTRVILNLAVDMGIPNLEELMGSVLEVKLKENLKMMLEGIEEKIKKN